MDYFDVSVLIYDRDHWFSEDQNYLVYRKGSIYPDRYLIFNNHNVEIKEDRSVYFDNEKVYEANNEFLMIIVDELSGNILDIVNVDNLIRE